MSDEDTTALVVNPANLAFLPGSELRWSSVYLNEDALASFQGNAFAFGFPIPFLSLSTGLRLDVVSPPDALSNLRFHQSARYEWLTWGVGFKFNNSLAAGFSLQRSYSDIEALHDLASWSAGLTSRPWDRVGIAFVGRDLNAPANGGGVGVSRIYDIAVAIRPFASRALEIGLEGQYLDRAGGYWIPRATLGVDVPDLGRLRADVSVADPDNSVRSNLLAGIQGREWLASVAFAFNFNGSTGSMELGAGSIFGDALGATARYRAHENLGVEVAFRGFREPAGTEGPKHALRIRIEDTPSVRRHTALLRRLWSIAEDEPAVDAVVLELRSAPADSLAHAEELRDAIYYLRQSGKRVLCHLEDGDGSSLYVCSAADRILVNPAGGIRFAGLRARYFYFSSLLEKLGVHADFVRIGAHKSAPEMFTREGSSDVSRDDKIDLLQQYERRFTLDVSAGRHISGAELRQRIATGPFVAAEAKQAGLVDGFAFDDQLEAEVSKLAGRDLMLFDDKRAPRSKAYFADNPGIAVVYVDGDMVDGRSQTIPLLGTRLVGSYTIAENLRQVRENRQIGAVILRIETGGGSAMAADVIWREVALTAKVKPVIVSMGSAAASGGYYIASPATRILANPLTLTGSIGIFYGKADVAELLRRIGVNIEVYKTAPRADAESIFRPFTDPERKELEHKVAQFYEMFLSRVAEGRKLKTTEVDAVGQGRVWTGEQAVERKLVDELGGLRQAIALARRLGHLSQHSGIIELPPPDTSLIGRLLGVEGVRSEASEAASPAALLPSQLLDLVRALQPFVIHASDQPLALMEITQVLP